jgi:hypothetical protein
MDEQKLEAKKGWENVVLGRISGSWIELKEAPGLHIRPKKLTLDSMDIVKRNSVSDSDINTEGKTDEEIQELVKEKMNQQIKNNNLSLLDEKMKAIIYAVLSGGIAEHDFIKEDGKKEDFTDTTFLHTFLNSYYPLALEMFKEVMEFNRPLAEEKSENLTMS